jgi:hypothetical protein
VNLVAINLKAVSPQGTPLEGVTLTVFSEDLSVRHLVGQTDQAGMLTGMLYDETTYEIRSYRPDSTPMTYQLVLGVDEPAQELEMEVRIWAPGDSVNPTMCRVYETFFAPSGEAVEGFVAIKALDVVGTAHGLISRSGVDRKLVRGHLTVDLPRGVIMQFELPGTESIPHAPIPDLPSARLSDFLFPYLQVVQLSSSTPISLTVGQEVVLTVEYINSAGVVVEDGANAFSLAWTYDSEVLSLSVEGSSLRLRGLVAGSTEVTAEETCSTFFPEDLHLRRFPKPAILGLPFTVEVV